MNSVSMEIRRADVSLREVEGRVAPYDETTYLVREPGGERLIRGCFTKSIKDRAGKIPLLIGHHHDQGAIGASLADRWLESDEGLAAVFRVREGERGDAALADIEDGLLQDLSVGFIPIPSRVRRGPDGANEVHEAVLREVSLVTVGAYDGARVLAARQASPVTDWLYARPEVNLSPIPAPWLH